MKHQKKEPEERTMTDPEKLRVINLRDLTEDFFYDTKAAAALERMSPKDWVISVVEQRLEELRRSGRLPKLKP